ncbi:hypothetical protein [Candidatus Tisiphia endosymbiont of Hybos culiciformis]|uniref:hypothetical protein n=1 Tax=Candidatus Tisiphia endosymbiont of Hybos culiciformis TaxID=3139331 RepID=UPI003CCABB14
MIKNITIVSCHSRVGGNLDTCFRRYDTKFVSPNSIGFTIIDQGSLKVATNDIRICFEKCINVIARSRFATTRQSKKLQRQK